MVTRLVKASLNEAEEEALLEATEDFSWLSSIVRRCTCLVSSSTGSGAGGYCWRVGDATGKQACKGLPSALEVCFSGGGEPGGVLMRCGEMPARLSVLEEGTLG